MHLLTSALYVFLEVILWLVLLGVLFRWLIQFGIITDRLPPVRRIMYFSDRVCSLVRDVVPPLYGIDFSPLIVLIAINLLQYVLKSL